MAKWTTLPSEPLRFQPHQDAFLKARRLRWCAGCQAEYSTPPDPECPTCKVKGQRKFHRLTIIAGRRFGKSRFGSIAGTEEACIPNSIGWACAPSNPKLHRYVIPAFQQLIPPEWVASWNSEYLDLRLKNGSLIHFQTLEDPDQGRGQGLDWLWIDEVCELSDRHWEVISPSLAGPSVAFFTTTPRGYDWVHDKLYKPAEEGILGFWGCHAPTSSSANPRISKEFLDSARIDMSETMYRQEYEADFVTFTGAVYGDLVLPQILRSDEQVKAILPEWPKIHADRQVIVGLDTGADHPFGAVKLISTEKGLVVVGEYLERHKSFVEHANAIKWLANSPQARWGINKNERQPMIELAQHGIFCQKSQNDIVAGTERVKTWLHNKQLWFIESACPQTIKQLNAYRWAEATTRDGQTRDKEKVYKKSDELPDCLRYALMTWPQLPVPLVDKDKKRDVSALPQNMQDTINMMRKIDATPKPKEADVTGDFWL